MKHMEVIMVISLMLVSSDDVWRRSHDNNQGSAMSSIHHVY